MQRVAVFAINVKLRRDHDLPVFAVNLLCERDAQYLKYFTLANARRFYSSEEDMSTRISERH